MAHIHIAIFKWKESVTQAQIEDALAQVRQVADRVPGVRNIYCGKNTSRWAQGYTDGVVVIADDEQALDDYRKDEVHAKAAGIIEEMELDGIGVDFYDPT